MNASNQQNSSEEFNYEEISDFLQTAVLMADKKFFEAKTKLQVSASEYLKQHYRYEATLENAVLSQSFIEFAERGAL